MSNTKLPALPPHPAIRDGITWRDDERKAIDEYARAAILADRERQAGEAVARVRTWTKNGEGHGELVDWLGGADALPDGEHDLYAATIASLPAPQAVQAGCGHCEKGGWCGRRDCENIAAAPSPDGKAEQAEAPSDAEMVCAEAYQVVGSLLADLGQFETERARKILDNLSDAKMVHSDVLPWPSFANQPTASNAGERERIQNLYEKHTGLFITSEKGLENLLAFVAALATKPPAGEQKPFAWATFDGEGSYDLRLFEDNEDYRDQFIKRNGPQFTSWVLALYLRPQPEQVAQDAEHAENYRLIRRGQHWSVVDGIGNTLRGEDLDDAVGAIRAARARGEGGDKG